MINATKQVEFEIKAPIKDFNDIKQLLVDVEYVNEKVNTDTYYDVPSYDLFKLGIFLRLRDSLEFEIKFNPNLQDVAHNICDEYAFHWPLNLTDYAQAKNFLKSYLPTRNTESNNIVSEFGLQEFVTIKKRRKVFQGDGVLICLDEVEGLGKFIEIEATSSQKVSSVIDYSRRLGLENMTLGYVELYLRATNFPIYKQGRYLLKEDI